jgi:purine-nucleoside phosphorylase
METSAVFALAEFHRREAASLMIVSDELSSGSWRHGFFETGLEESVRRHFLPFL